MDAMIESALTLFAILSEADQMEFIDLAAVLASRQ